MALTAGLLTFLGVEALFEAFDRQALLPQGMGGAGLVLLGVALSYLGMTFLSARLRSGGREAGADGRSRCSLPSGSASTTSAKGSRSGARSLSVSCNSGRS